MMQLNMGTWRGSVAIVCFLAMLIGCTGCGTVGDRQDTQQQTESAGSDASKTKIANSIPDYIDFLLDLDAKPDTKYPMSDAQKTILKLPESREAYRNRITSLPGRITSSA